MAVALHKILSPSRSPFHDPRLGHPNAQSPFWNVQHLLPPTRTSPWVTLSQVSATSKTDSLLRRVFCPTKSCLPRRPGYVGSLPLFCTDPAVATLTLGSGFWSLQGYYKPYSTAPRGLEVKWLTGGHQTKQWKIRCINLRLWVPGPQPFPAWGWEMVSGNPTIWKRLGWRSVLCLGCLIPRVN